jgi:hypothetical protein
MDELRSAMTYAVFHAYVLAAYLYTVTHFLDESEIYHELNTNPLAFLISANLDWFNNAVRFLKL